MSKILKIDQQALKEHLSVLNQTLKEFDKVYANKDFSTQSQLDAIQDLLYSYAVIIKDRTWCAQRLLPVCPEFLFCDAMPNVKEREECSNFLEADSKFDFKQRNFLARGGEVYYLHLLEYFIHDHRDEQQKLESLLYFLLTETCPQISILANFVQSIWDNKIIKDSRNENIQIYRLSFIPKNRYRQCEEYAVKELINFLSSNFDSISKIVILANGMMLQIIRMIIVAVKDICKRVGYVTDAFNLVISINPNNSSDLFKKFAHQQFEKLSNVFETVISIARKEFYSELTDINEIMNKEKEVKTNSLQIIKKIGKELKFVVPSSGNAKYERFSLNEDLVKFLVLSIVPPGEKLTYDNFLEELQRHFNFIIGNKEYTKYCNGDNKSLAAEFTANSKEFLKLLQCSGFLKELSDATSVVVNPYQKIIQG